MSFGSSVERRLNSDSSPARPASQAAYDAPAERRAKGMADASVTTLGSMEACPGVLREADRPRGIRPNQVLKCLARCFFLRPPKIFLDLTDHVRHKSKAKYCHRENEINFCRNRSPKQFRGCLYNGPQVRLC